MTDNLLGARVEKFVDAHKRLAVQRAEKGHSTVSLRADSKSSIFEGKSHQVSLSVPIGTIIGVPYKHVEVEEIFRVASMLEQKT